MTRPILIAVLGCVAALLAFIVGQASRIDTLRDETARQKASIAALTMQAEQSALARDVERARAKAAAKRNAELSATVEALLTGDIPDEALDPRIADFINGLQDD